MVNIYITGSNGFIGKNLISYYKSNNNINLIPINRNQLLQNNYRNSSTKDIIIHLAGIAHELKKQQEDDIYYNVNTDLTKIQFEFFLNSPINKFIFISTIKAVSDYSNDEITEDTIPNPISIYGKSKLNAENFILSKVIPENKLFYILRPCMIYGPNNKGNFIILNKFIKYNFPWLLTNFINKRSYCYIENFNFIINELIFRNDIQSGIYNIADDEPISTNRLVQIIYNSNNKNPKFLSIPKFFINFFIYFTDLFGTNYTYDKLNKLTQSLFVSNYKIKQAIKKKLPYNTIDGLTKTFKNLNN